MLKIRIDIQFDFSSDESYSRDVPDCDIPATLLTVICWIYVSFIYQFKNVTERPQYDVR